MEYVKTPKDQFKSELEAFLLKGEQYIAETSENELSYKPSLNRWSKKEILGHLIDSGINNLQRFTKMQFEAKPFVIQKYNQDELVKANDYQNADIRELLGFWLAVNYRILKVIDLQNEKTLAYGIFLGNGETADLKFLIADYVNHLAHHLNQIMAKQQ